ncbi:MAG: nucleoside-diphosphate kinase [Candidatus Altiarchaeales archaeon ex4484_2]|nr:MAG: nucleoside-diphosphate kinase [Candidatus Altiarchaeales archaeon ex4484_2]
MKTLVVIKPDGVERGLVGEIISRFEKYGFSIKAIKITQLNRETAERLYAVHEGKTFFDDLIQYVTSGHIIPLVIEMKDSGIEEGIKLIRKIVGATNPLEAEMGSIRGDYASDISYNIVHASDSEKSNSYETPIFFNKEEILD